LQIANVEIRKGLSLYQLLIYIAAFIVSGALSYNFLISPKIRNLKSAQHEYKSEKALLESKIEKANRINVLHARYQKIENDLNDIQNRVFTEAKTMDFFRFIPQLAVQTGNSLVSITPSEAKDPEEENKKPKNVKQARSETQNKKKTDIKENKDNKDNKAQDSTGTVEKPKAQYMLKPVEIVIAGKYPNVVYFFDQLEKLQKYMKISSIRLTQYPEDESQVSARFMLKLIQMNINMPKLLDNTPSSDPNSAIKMAKYTQVEKNKAISVATEKGINNRTQVPSNKASAISSIPVTKKSDLANRTVQVAKNTQSLGNPKINVAKPLIEKQPVANAKIIQKPVQTFFSKKLEQKNRRLSNQTFSKNLGKKDQALVKIEKNVPSTTLVKSPAVSKTSNKNATNIEYTVQVGIFYDQEHTDRLSSKLKSYGFETWVRDGFLRKRAAKYVYSGKFQTEMEARLLGRSMHAKVPFVRYYYIVKNIYAMGDNGYGIQKSIVIE